MDLSHYMIPSFDLMENFHQFIVNITANFADTWYEFLQWLSRPDILAIITAWWITFTIVMILLMSLGFGPRGIIAGSMAAAFQSFMYGGFTPAGGIFATVTSMAMLGTVMPPFVILASFIATGVSMVVWKLGVGR